jgi:signal transduction histidine kinase
MLTLARPDETAFEPLDVNETIREVLPLFEPQVRAPGVELEPFLAPDLPAVRGNRGKLQQVLLNLLQNARDAVGESGRIRVSTAREGTRIVIEVADDGAGIADEDLPRIFDPFFTTKGRGKGTGLGLSVSYGIVRQHAGTIRVDSRPGGWTRFRIELPGEGVVRAMAR